MTPDHVYLNIYIYTVIVSAENTLWQQIQLTRANHHLLILATNKRALGIEPDTHTHYIYTVNIGRAWLRRLKISTAQGGAAVIYKMYTPAYTYIRSSGKVLGEWNRLKHIYKYIYMIYLYTRRNTQRWSL